MNKTTSLISLMAALAAGSAMAAPTTAGTQITNTATATFNDETNTPVTGPNGAPPSTSNTVVSTVQAVPAFTISPNTADRTPVSAIPGEHVTFNKYTLTNTGNVNGDSYTITTGGLDLVTIGGKTVQTPAVVYYFTQQPTSAQLTNPAANGGQTSLSFTGLSAGDSRDFWVMYQVPTTAANGAVYSSNPVGKRNANTSIPNGVADGTAPDDANNQNEANVSRNDSFQVGPKDFAGGNAPANTLDTTTAPGYAIVATGDNQTATVNINNGQTVFTFTETLQNTGTRTDSYALSTSLSNFPNGTTVRYFLGNTELTAATGITIGGTAYPTVENVAPNATVNFTVQVNLGTISAPLAGTPVATVGVTSQNSTSAAGGSGGTNGATDPTTNTLNVRYGAFGDFLGGTLSNSPTQAQNVTPNGTSATARYTMAVQNLGSVAETFFPAAATGTINQVVIPTVNPDGSINQAPAATPITYYQDDGNGQPTGSLLSSSNPLSVPAGATVRVVALVAVPANAAATNTALSFVQQFQSSTASPTPVPANTSTITVSDGTYTIGSTTYGTPNADQFTVRSGGTLLMDGTGGTGKIVVNCGELLAACASVTTEVTSNNVKPGDYLKYVIRMKNTRNGAVNSVIMQDILNGNVDFVNLAASLLDGMGNTVTGPSANFAYRHAATTAGINAAPWTQLGTGFSNTFDSTTHAPITVSAGSTFQVAVDSASTLNTINSADTLNAMHTVVVTVIVRVK